MMSTKMIQRELVLISLRYNPLSLSEREGESLSHFFISLSERESLSRFNFHTTFHSFISFFLPHDLKKSIQVEW